ncbi:37375_t:CDS:2, partial [Gigaspora margarita]
AEDLTSIALLIAEIPNYNGQIPPDECSSISQAELDSMIKSQLALVPTTSIHSSQLQKTQALQSQQKQPNFSDYLRVPDKYMPEKLLDGYGINSEKFFIPVQSKKNIEVDSDEELANRMGKLSINKALSKDAETSPLVSVPISKKKKQSLKSKSQDEQSHLEKIIEKIIEKKLNE